MNGYESGANLPLSNADIEEFFWVNRDEICPMELKQDLTKRVNDYVNIFSGHSLIAGDLTASMEQLTTVLEIQNFLVDLRNTLLVKLNSVSLEALKICKKDVDAIEPPPYLEGVVRKLIQDAKSKVRQRQLEPNRIKPNEEYDDRLRNEAFSKLAWGLLSNKHYHASTETALSINIDTYLKYGTPVYERSGILQALAKVYREKGNVEKLIELQDKIPCKSSTLDVKEENVMALLTQEKKDYSRIIELANQLDDEKSYYRRSRSFYRIAQTQLNEGLLEEAFGTANNEVRSDHYPNYYRSKALEEVTLAYFNLALKDQSVSLESVITKATAISSHYSVEIWKKIGAEAAARGNVELERQCLEKVPQESTIPIVESNPFQEVKTETLLELIGMISKNISKRHQETK